MTLAIEATGLVKVFGDTRAIDGVDLAVRRGSVYALGASALLTAVFAPLTVRLYRSR
jgi:ABC-type transporter Mla maintaining outer membrane lipid asymmetry ATPase subunit MlaF